MYKLSAIAIAGGFILASSTLPVWAASDIQEASVPYLTTSRAVPRNARVSLAKYQFGLNVAGYPISQISIGIPELMRVGDISVRGADRKLIETTTKVDDRTALITFAQPVSPGTSLRIELSSVRTLPRSGRVWLLPIAVRGADAARNLPIGTVRIHTYS